jgi:hypothetical protein
MGYWGYGGFNNINPTPPWVGGYPGYVPPYGGPGYGPLPGQGPGDTFGDGHPKKKAGGITGFFQGIAQGGVNLIKGIFSPGGLLMLGVTGALTWATGGAILPILGAFGAGVGGFQILKGVANGDSEKAGEGLFNLGTSMLGFLGPSKFSVAGKAYELEGSGFKAKLGSIFGLSKYKHIPSPGEAAGPSKNLYELAASQIRGKFGGWSSSTGAAATGGASTGAAAGVSSQAKHVGMINEIRNNKVFSSKLSSSDKAALQNMEYRLLHNDSLNVFQRYHLKNIHTRLYQVEHPFPKKPSLWSRWFKKSSASSTASATSTWDRSSSISRLLRLRIASNSFSSLLLSRCFFL